MKILPLFLKDFCYADFFSSSVFIIISLALVICGLIYVCVKLHHKNKEANYYLNIIRTISKSLAQTNEIVVFDESDNILYATHPHLYQKKGEFFKSLISRIKPSLDFKNFCDSINLQKNFSNIIERAAEGLNQNKKLIATCNTVDQEESYINETISIAHISDISKHVEESEKILRNYEKIETFLDKFPLGIFYVNNLGIIIGANSTFAELLKTNRNKLIGAKIKDFIANFHYDIPSQQPINASIKPRFSSEIKVTLIKSSISSIASQQPWIVCQIEQAAKSKLPHSQETENEFLSQNTFVFAPVPSVIVVPSGEIKAFNPAFATMIQDKLILEKNTIVKTGSNIFEFVLNSSTKDVLNHHLEHIVLSNENPEPIEIKFIGGNIDRKSVV